MGRVTKAKLHLEANEVLEKIKNTIEPGKVKKWLVIWNAIVAPRTAAEIAIHVGLAKQTVHNLISQYNRYGPNIIEGKVNKGIRRRCYLTLEEEKKFLEPFIEKAEIGLVTTVAKIKESLEEKLGHSVDKSMVYRLLNRHGWRKITPRPYHLQSKKQEQEEFKKNFKKK